MLSVLRRHLLLATISAVGGAIALFVFILATVNLLRDLLAPMLDGRLPAVLFLKLSWLLLPYVITYALPMGMLLGVLLVLGRLSADNEILAMRAAGLSLRRICRPIFVLALAGVALELTINFYLMPKARVEYHALFDQTIRNTALDFIKPKTFVRGVIKNTIIYAHQKEGDRLIDFWLWETDSQGRALRICHAESARPLFNPDEALVELELTNARLENRNPKNPESTEDAPVIGTFESTTLRIPLESLLGRASVRRKLDWMTLPQLVRERERLVAAQSSLAEIRKVDITLSQKCTSAIAVLAFTLVAIPLGIRTQRKETSANLGIAVALVLTYYVLSTGLGALDRHPELRPDLWIWLPNILFLSTGIWMMRRVDRV